MKFEFALTDHDRAAYEKIVTRRISKAAKANTKTFIVNIIAFLPVGAALAFYVDLYKRYPNLTSELNTIAIAVCVAAALITASGIYKRKLIESALLVSDAKSELQSIEANQSGLQVTSAGVSSHCEWARLRDFVEDDQALYLFLDISNGFIIPKRVFNSTEELSQLRHWINASNNAPPTPLED